SGVVFFGRADRPHARTVGIHKIRHVVVIMQENRSFDSYFGTYPGAGGGPRGFRGRTGASRSASRIPARTSASGPSTTPATGTAVGRTSKSTQCATCTAARWSDSD